MFVSSWLQPGMMMTHYKASSLKILDIRQQPKHFYNCIKEAYLENGIQNVSNSIKCAVSKLVYEEVN